MLINVCLELQRFKFQPAKTSPSSTPSIAEGLDVNTGPKVIPVVDLDREETNEEVTLLTPAAANGGGGGGQSVSTMQPLRVLPINRNGSPSFVAPQGGASAINRKVVSIGRPQVLSARNLNGVVPGPAQVTLLLYFIRTFIVIMFIRKGTLK